MYVTVGISARPDSEAREVRFLVDTGAFYSMVPRTILEELGITRSYRETLRVADGRTVERDVGFAFLHYPGCHPGPTIVVFAEPGDTLVLGVHTLEGLGLKVDPRSGTISVMDVIPYYSAAATLMAAPSSLELVAPSGDVDRSTDGLRNVHVRVEAFYTLPDSGVWALRM